MFSFSKLPRITFLEPDRELSLDLSQCSGQIQRVVDSLPQISQAGATVGLVFKSSPSLVIAWLGVVASGRVPLILQYPNEKISKHY